MSDEIALTVKNDTVRETMEAMTWDEFMNSSIRLIADIWLKSHGFQLGPYCTKCKKVHPQKLGESNPEQILKWEVLMNGPVFEQFRAHLMIFGYTLTVKDDSIGKLQVQPVKHYFEPVSESAIAVALEHTHKANEAYPKAKRPVSYQLGQPRRWKKQTSNKVVKKAPPDHG